MIMRAANAVNVPARRFVPAGLPKWDIYTSDDFFMGEPSIPISYVVYVSNFEDSVLMIGFNYDLNRAYLSLDNGETWRCILRKPGLRHAMYTGNPDVNRSILISDVNGRMYRSTDLDSHDEGDWELVLDTGNGKNWFSRSLAWDRLGNVVLRGTYGNHDASDPPRFVYGSDDYGETFRKILEVPVSEMGDPGNFHIHSVAFDPWTKGRIWVANGDGANNAQLRYTDDFGETWIKVHERNSEDFHQPTLIQPTPLGVLFGSDEYPTGFRIWRRNFREQRAVVKSSDIEVLWSPDDFDRSSLGGYAVRPGTDMGSVFDEYPYHLSIPWVGSGSYYSPYRIFTSPDGLEWWELFNGQDISWNMSVDWSSYAGPVSNDPERRIYLRAFIPGVGIRQIVVRHPGWIEV